MGAIDELKELANLHDFARYMKYKPSQLAYIIYGISDANKYKTFEIPKKTGGTRVITTPCQKLMLLQRKTAHVLQDCLEEIFEISNQKKSLSHGFRKEHSIVTNASVHRARRFVLNFDMKDFFDQFNFGRVRGFFIKNNNLLLSPDVATIIAQIACFSNKLPQGAPTSPVITNLISSILDIRLKRIAVRNKCLYTRYADDITFSTNTREFPSQIACQESDHSWHVSDYLAEEIRRFGFEINDTKTRLQYKYSRQEVTGLVCNRILNTPCEYRKKARAMADKLFKSGSYVLSKNSDTGEEVAGTLQQLIGIYAYIDYIDRVRSEIRDEEFTELKRTEKYKQIVFFKEFYVAEMPTLIFEGKTDRIYIKCALKKLYEQFPRLAKKEANEVNIQIRLPKCEGLLKRFYKLGNGTSSLANFIKNYKRAWSIYEAESGDHPVIIVVDNDDGKKAISVTMKYHGVDFDHSKKFQHVVHNLYVVCVPGEGSAIEDLFPSWVLKTQLEGKSFNRTNKNAGPNEYGKTYFARHVVNVNYDNIDFSGFTELLGNIDSAILDYSVNKSNY